MLPKSQRIYHAKLFPMPWNRMQITLLQILNLMKLHTLPSTVWKKVLSVPGIHNVSNALSAITLGRKLGLSLESIQKGLLHFGGTDRRFQYKGKVGGVTVIDDYAHHPTEIKATLKAAKHYPHNELWCVFQPHTYTRTKAFLDEFAQALSAADEVILADIYAARDK